MSLYLPGQRLGNHSQESGSSSKFVLKGRQTNGVHRAHAWVFRAESYDTMMAWYEDIKALTEKSPEERNDFVRGHTRAISRSSSRRSLSSDGVVDDDDDDEPYSAHNSEAALGNGTGGYAHQQAAPRRPSPGGRFPSDIEVSTQRGLQAPHSPSSINGSMPSPVPYHEGQQHQHNDIDAVAATGALPASSFDQYYQSVRDDGLQNGYNAPSPYGAGYTYQEAPTQTATAAHPQANQAPYHSSPAQTQASEAPYANHPATIIVARAAQNKANGSHEEQAAQINTNGSHEEQSGYNNRQQASNYDNALGLEQGDRHPVEAVPVSAPYASGLDVTGLKEISVVSATDMGHGTERQMEKRPANKERMESGFSSLNSGVQGSAHLHVPGEYPNANCVKQSH